MNVVAIVLLSVLGILVTWLLVDTIIYIVRKSKQKKQLKDDNKLDDSSN